MSWKRFQAVATRGPSRSRGLLAVPLNLTRRSRPVTSHWSDDVTGVVPRRRRDGLAAGGFAACQSGAGAGSCWFGGGRGTGCARGCLGASVLGVSGEQRTTATFSDTRAVATLCLWPGRWKVTLFSQGESLKTVDEGTPAFGVATGKAGLVLHALSYL